MNPCWRRFRRFGLAPRPPWRLFARVGLRTLPQEVSPRIQVQSKNKNPSEWTPKMKRSAFDAALAARGFRDLSAWYQISRRDMYSMGLGGILSNHYNNSPQAALADIYPDHKWLPWKFSLSRRIWENLSNRKMFLQHAGDILGVKTPDAWYHVTASDFSTVDGSASFVAHYGGSLGNGIMDTLTDHVWYPWMFHHAPRSLFDSSDQRRRYMEWLGQRLGYIRTQDWYGITKSHFEQNHGASLLAHKFGNSARRAVIETFPEHDWVGSRFGSND